MIVFAISAVFSLLDVMSLTVEGFISAVFGFVVYGYFFVVLYTLFDKFRQENDQPVPVGLETIQIAEPAGK